jgi:Ca2+-binding RTX toxin-like protein
VTWEAALTLNDTIVTGGASLGTFPPAGGISVVYGSLSLNDCVITANTATDLDWGAGIGAYESDVHLNRTTISGNDGGYGVSVLFGEAVIENSAVVQNEDGGIFGYWTDVRVENTTIASNGGAGVRAHWLDVRNSTVTGNLDTGVVAIEYTLHLANSVVSGNHGSVAREVEFFTHWQSGNDFGTTSNNVFGHDGDAGLLNVVPDATDIVPAGPLSSILEPELRANGGPTPTYLLRTTSPARDAGATQFCSAQDQRGVTRPQGAACDIGAVELVPDPCATAVPSSGCTVNGVPNQRCLGTDGADTIVGTTGDDVIVARSGDDVVWARTGNDIVCGGKGDDALHGGGGTDQLWGSQGADSLSGDPGTDSLDGGPGADACSSDGSDVNLISCY